MHGWTSIRVKRLRAPLEEGGERDCKIEGQQEGIAHQSISHGD
jgi:hypothetical protein